MNLVALARQPPRTALYLVVGTPYQMGVQLYSDALGFSILQQANRYYEWTPATAQWLLIGILVGRRRAARGRDDRARGPGALVTGIAAALAVGILAWNVTGEIAAASGTVSISRAARGNAAASVHLGRPRREAEADALPRPGRRRPEPRVGARVLEPLDRHGRQPRRDARRPGPERDAEHDGRRARLLDASTRRIRAASTTTRSRTGRASTSPGPVAASPSLQRRRRRAEGVAADQAHQAEPPPRAVQRPLRRTAGAGRTTARTSASSRRSPAGCASGSRAQNWPSTPVHVQLAVDHDASTASRRSGASSTTRRRSRARLKTNVIWVRTPRRALRRARRRSSTSSCRSDVDPRIGDPRTLGAQVDYRFFTKLPRGVKPQHSKVKR